MSVENEPIYMDPAFWVSSAFVLFVGFVAWKGAFKKLGAMLDARGARIKAQLDEAQRLRDEAAALLAEFEARQKQAETDAKAMLAHAVEDAGLVAKNAEIELEALIARRTKLAADQIAQAEANAVAEVRKAAVGIAAAAASKVIAESLDAKAQGELVKSSIDELGAKLN